MREIVIVDYGMGNLRSVQKGFEKVGHAAVITSDPQRVGEADKVWAIADVFELDNDGLVKLRQGVSEDEAVREACDNCPMGAITLAKVEAA